jgi:hypothetical protein
MAQGRDKYRCNPRNERGSGRPLAHYELDGNANDASTYHRHGMAAGCTPAADRSGNPQSAMSFDGNDFVVLSQADLPVTNDDNVFVGHPDPTSSIPSQIHPFQGSLDDLRICNRALSAEEIAQLQ